jgi:hypothetical protein
MESMDMDMFMECCKRMMSMMSGGMPMMMIFAQLQHRIRHHNLWHPSSSWEQIPKRVPTS